MDDKQKQILEKTRAFIEEYKQLDSQKRRLAKKFMEELSQLGDEKTIAEIDQMLNDL